MSGSNPKAAGAGSTAGPRVLVAGKEEKKKAGGGVLNRLKARRQAPHHAADDGFGAAVTEQELLALDAIRPEHVLRLGRVTESECRAAAPSPRANARARPRSPLALPLRPGRDAQLRGPGLRPISPRDVAGKGSPCLTAFPGARPPAAPGPLALRRAVPSSAGLGWVGPFRLTGSSGPGPWARCPSPEEPRLR